MFKYVYIRSYHYKNIIFWRMAKNTNSKNIVLIALLSLSNINGFSSITVKKKENGELILVATLKSFDDVSLESRVLSIYYFFVFLSGLELLLV